MAARPLLAVAVFAVVLWGLSHTPLILASLIASVAYVLATLILGVWDQREKDLVRGLLTGSRPDATSLASDG